MGFSRIGENNIENYYRQKYYEQIKDLLVDLQKYIIEIDKYNLNIISQDYREKYFEFIDCEYVQIDVFAYNEHAKKFYYKNGYEDRTVTVLKNCKTYYTGLRLLH